MLRLMSLLNESDALHLQYSVLLDRRRRASSSLKQSQLAHFICINIPQLIFILLLLCVV